MSNHLGIDRTLQLLNSLKETVSEFAASEEKLNQELRGRIGTLRQRREAALEEQAQRLAAELAAAEAAFQAKKQAVEAHHEHRYARIYTTQSALHKRGQEETDNREGQGKYRLQSETLQNNRSHKDGLAAAEKNFEDFKTTLAQHRQFLAATEARARDGFRGYRRFVRFLAAAPAAEEPEPALDEHQLEAEFLKLIETTGLDLDRFRRRPLPWFFKYPLLWVLVLLVPFGLVPVLRASGREGFGFAQAGLAAGGLLVLGVALYFIGRSGSQPQARRIAVALGKAQRLLEACGVKAEAHYKQELERVENQYQTRLRNMDDEWKTTLAEVTHFKEQWPRLVDEKAARAQARNEAACQRRVAQLEQEQAREVDRLQQASEARVLEITTTFGANETRLQAESQARWQTLETDWQNRIRPLYHTLEAARGEAERLFPPWQPPQWENWQPPAEFAHAACFARLEVDVAKLAGALPGDARLALPGSAHLSVPLLLTYPDRGSALFETTHAGQDEVLQALNNIILRLLSVSPPGRLNFTIIDPVGLGQSFAGVMHLADYEEHLIHSRIWTQTTQIEERLKELNEHMEKVIQMYLRNEYETIAEYNKQAGNIAEKYQLLVVANFPVNFSDIAARRLLSIATSGARCGVYTLIHWDQRQPRPQDFVPEEIRKSSIGITCKGQEFMLTGPHLPGVRLLLDAPPDPEFAIQFVNKVGRISIDSNRVEVPFSHVAPAEADVWTLETTSELRVAIGRTGATKLQYLAIGKDTRQHALVAGKTGSGKSTLFHVIITNLALWCSPEQVEFYLVDFKKGVEFKCYATRHLPHARVVAIESDREFGLSVLQRVDDELKRRGDLFRKLGVQDIPGYKRAGGTEPVPRCLLMIDEFQEFFVEDDKISQTASVLMDRIVRQGRAFGIHVLLGSQTLGGAYTVARTTLGQMVIRIALQCNEADAYLIMDDSNPAPRLLSRPGEGIYNDNAGALEGNSPFQVVWLPDEVRDASLARVRARADQTPGAYEGPIVFEGNAPADVRENRLLRVLLEAPSVKKTAAPRFWLGAPNSIKGPTEAVFHRQSGNNLLMVGQRDEAILAMLAVSVVSLAAQHAAGGARIIVLDSTPPETPQRAFIDHVAQVVPGGVTLARQAEMTGILAGLGEEMKRRAEDDHAGEAPPVFLFVHGLQKFNKLRFEEDFSFSSDDGAKPANPAAILNNLVCEGARLGFHVIITCDTYNNVNRFLSRKALSEFEMRVLFQMSANDSASLIDSPKASNLGLHRALFYNEQEGYLETFRPYALPGEEWLDQAGRHLARLLKA